MKITQEVRDYAAAQEGMAQKSAEFRAGGSEIYIPLNKEA
jgi:phosphomethylpyrimidine synthase